MSLIPTTHGTSRIWNNKMSQIRSDAVLCVSVLAQTLISEELYSKW